MLTKIFLLLAFLEYCSGTRKALAGGVIDACSEALDLGGCDNERQHEVKRFYFDQASGECLPFQWKGCTGNKNKFKSKSFCEKACKGAKKACSRISCEPHCRNFIGADGCAVCRCEAERQPERILPDREDAPRVNSERRGDLPILGRDNWDDHTPESSRPDRCPVCYMHCEYGPSTQLGPDGCEVCECNPEPRMPLHCPMCTMYCEYGFSSRRGADGCDICECNRQPQQPEEPRHCPTCSMFCEYGYSTKRGPDGCDICECNEMQPLHCPICMMRCEHGYSTSKGSDGCAICRCNDRPTDCSRKPQCRMYCEHGFRKGDDGCDICECELLAIPGVDCSRKPQCRMYCEHGFRKGDDGCDICECKLLAIPGVDCSRKPQCHMHCEHGFKKEKSTDCDSALIPMLCVHG